MKTVLVLIFVMLAVGCAELNAAKAGVAIHGARAADTELEVAEWGVCQAVTMGAWQRRYGSKPDKIDGWRKLCSREPVAP